MFEDLLRQAEQLALIDVRRPRQVNLRRAISAVYFAVFHTLVHEACCAQMGAQQSQTAVRQVLGRAFGHAVMKQACAAFAGGTLKASVRKGLPAGFSIPTEIRALADLFVTLQQQRHLADYDLTERFRRSDVENAVKVTRRCVADFAALPASNERKFYLACLWAWKELTNR